MKKYSLIVLMMLTSLATCLAQTVEMATRLRSEGKIYVVVAVMLVIFLGVALYLFSLDRKVKKLEKDN